MLSSPFWRTLTSGSEGSRSAATPRAGGAGNVRGFRAGGATAFTPGSWMPGGGGTLLAPDDCANAAGTSRLETSMALAATSRTAVFMAATSVGKQSIAAPLRVAVKREVRPDRSVRILLGEVPHPFDETPPRAWQAQSHPYRRFIEAHGVPWAIGRRGSTASCADAGFVEYPPRRPCPG